MDKNKNFEETIFFFDYYIDNIDIYEELILLNQQLFTLENDPKVIQKLNKIMERKGKKGIKKARSVVT